MSYKNCNNGLSTRHVCTIFGSWRSHFLIQLVVSVQNFLFISWFNYIHICMVYRLWLWSEERFYTFFNSKNCFSDSVCISFLKLNLWSVFLFFTRWMSHQVTDSLIAKILLLSGQEQFEIHSTAKEIWSVWRAFKKCRVITTSAETVKTDLQDCQTNFEN